MLSNIDRYKKDLETLIEEGELLHLAMQRECSPATIDKELKTRYHDKGKVDEVIKKIPSFKNSYQPWYSEAKALVKQLLPDRLSDFAAHYETPKSRKNLTCENYRIANYLQGLVCCFINS